MQNRKRPGPLEVPQEKKTTYTLYVLLKARLFTDQNAYTAL